MGKTNLLLRFCEDNFQTSHLSTIGTTSIMKESISKQNQLIWEDQELNFKFGIQPGSKDLKQLHKHTIEEQWE